MPIDIENLNPSTKFPYPLVEKEKKKDPKKKAEWVSIRSLSVDKVREIDEQTTESRSEFRQPQKANGKINRRAPLQRIEYREVTDQSLRSKLMWDEMIDEIHIYDKKGSLIPSTLEMKIKLMNESPDFAIYVAECIEILTEDEKGRKVGLEKNSLNSQSE